MYDIKPLELEWTRYRKKRRKPWYIGGFIFILLTLLAITFSGNIKIDLSKITTFFDSIKSDNLLHVQKIKSNVLLDSALDRLETANNISTDILKVKKTAKDIGIEIIEKKETKNLEILVDIPLLDKVHNPDISVPMNDRNKVHLDIVETSSVTAYKDVEKRFLQSGDVDDSLFLAKSYYKKGYYKEAEYWALETNKIDEFIEESVFIFVKSKAKLGHKNEAESILMNYISKTGSQEAKNILSRIKSDTL